MSAAEVQELAGKLQFTQLDPKQHWEGYWDAAFSGDKEKCKGYHGTWHFFKHDEQNSASTFDCIRAYNLSGDFTKMQFYSFYKDKPASGRAQHREDGTWVHHYERSMTDPYYMCNMLLAPSEKAEGKLACTVWRSVPVDASAVIRLQPALPLPLQQGVPQTQSNWTADHAAGAVWAAEGYLQDGPFRWSMGPIYSMQSLHLLTHMYIHEHATEVDPDKTVDFSQQPSIQARPKLDADPCNWMDGGTWEGTMTDLLWDEDGEMFRCSPRSAAWHPPSKKTGRPSVDSLLTLKRLLLYPDMMYGYYPEHLPTSQEAAEKRRGVRIEYGGMMKSRQEFRRIILRYSATGEALSLTEEVYKPRLGVSLLG